MTTLMKNSIKKLIDILSFQLKKQLLRIVVINMVLATGDNPSFILVKLKKSSLKKEMVANKLW